MDDTRTRLYLAKQARWQRLIKLLIKNGYHDIAAAHDYAGYIAFLARHPELNLGSDIFPEAPIETRQSATAHSQPTHTQSDDHTPHGGVNDLLGFFALPVALFKKKDIMEKDKKYQKIEEELKKEWKEKNPTIDSDSKEGLDYLYGSLDNPETPSLAKDAEKKFRELHPKETEKYDKKKTIVYKNIKDDHAVQFTQARIEEHTQKRFVLAKKTNPEVKIEEVQKQVEEKHWRDFATAYREKATDYAKKHEKIKQAVEKLNKEEVQQQVAEYRETTKKDVRMVEEKIHPAAPSVEATKRLEEAARKGDLQSPTPPPHLIVPSQTIILPKPTIYQPPTPSLVLPQKQEVSPSKLVTTTGQSLVSAPPQKQSFIQSVVTIVKKVVPAKPTTPTPVPTQQPPPSALSPKQHEAPATPLPPPSQPIVPNTIQQTTPQPETITNPPQPSQPLPPPLPRRRDVSLFDRLFRSTHALADVQYLASPPQAPSSAANQPQHPSTAGQIPHQPVSSDQKPSRPRPQRPRNRIPSIPRIPRLPPIPLAINPATLWIIVGAVVFVIVLTFFMVLFGGGIALPDLGGGGSGTGGGSSPGAAGAGCPSAETLRQNSQDRNTCRFLNPSINIFDTNISPEAIEFYVTKYSPTFVRAGKGDIAAFRTRVNYIVSRAKEAGLNPAIFLGYWKTESAFSTVGSRDMGCVGNGFYEQVDCAVGLRGPGSFRGALCARSGDANSPSCRELQGIRSNPIYSNYPISYPIKTFDDFAETYGPIAPNLEGPGRVNNNCISTYNKLIEVALELNACKAPAQPTGAIAQDGVHSCVVNASFIPYPGSYAAIGQGQYSFVCGHSRPIYNAIDTGVHSGGGTPALAVVSGIVTDNSNPVGGPALWLTGDDGRNYYYAHLRRESLVTGRVRVGQVIGIIAAASENAIARNNGVAHVHISAGTPGNGQSFSDPANIPMGSLLDSWCGINVCKGRPNAAY